MPNNLIKIVLGFCLGVTSQVATAALIIDVSYSGAPQYQSAFVNAKNTWQSLLGGYVNGFVTDTTVGSSAAVGQFLGPVKITATIVAIDGPGITLGQASPTELALDSSGFFLTTDGAMQFDIDDVASFSSSEFDRLVLHEMAHVLGFGSLWSLNGVYANGTGEFTGANATAAWQSVFGQTGTPDVELEGGPGTANGHWNENLGGAGLTGITDSLGRDMRDELMTGWLNPNSFISDLTIASFRDIGFTGATAVPEPGTNLLMATIGAVAFVVRRRRRSGPAAAK